MKNDRGLADLLQALDRELEERDRSTLASSLAPTAAGCALRRVGLPLDGPQGGMCVGAGSEASGPAQ